MKLALALLALSGAQALPWENYRFDWGAIMYPEPNTEADKQNSGLFRVRDSWLCVSRKPNEWYAPMELRGCDEGSNELLSDQQWFFTKYDGQPVIRLTEHEKDDGWRGRLARCMIRPDNDVGEVVYAMCRKGFEGTRAQSAAELRDDGTLSLINTNECLISIDAEQGSNATHLLRWSGDRANCLTFDFVKPPQ